MRRVVIALKKTAIVCHRWMGVTFCLLFLWWFVSGIFMMYWGYPEVTDADRLVRLPVLDAALIKLSPAEAARAVGIEQPTSVRLSSFDGRPAYYLSEGRNSAVVYADTGEQQDVFPAELNLRTAARWTGQPAELARIEPIEEPDQWTVGGGLRNLRPLSKYSFPDGQQVYISENDGEVAQYTTTWSRIYAHLGAIPHWLYYTPLRVNGKLWSRVVTWASGIATVAALLGLIVGLSMYSPSKKYRYDGRPSSIPYSGQKRLHTILGLFFGILAMTWAFSGMLSMEPFPLGERAPGNESPARRVQLALDGGRLDLARYEAPHPADVLARLDAEFKVKELDYASFAGEPVFHATDGAGVTRVIPVDARAAVSLTPARVMSVVTQAAGSENVAEVGLRKQYDRYYLDRTRERPLPVIYLELKDKTRMYIDPKTARLVGLYSDTTAGWVNRWLYHGLHSMNFPWLYNYRPAWDIVVLGLMLACIWLCWTSLALSYRVVKRNVGPVAGRRISADDLL